METRGHTDPFRQVFSKRDLDDDNSEKRAHFYETSRFVSDNDKEWFDAELLQNVKKELGADYEEMAQVDPLSIVSSF